MTRQYLYKCGNPDCGFVNATTQYYGKLIQSMTCPVCDIASDRHCIYGMAEDGTPTEMYIITVEDEVK